MGNIDWAVVHKHVDEIQAKLEKEREPSSEEIRNLLGSRARALARKRKEPVKSAPSISVVEFLLANETYGVETSYIREVYPLKELTPIPGTPAYILGVINVRGQILAVMDLKKFFSLPDKGLTDLNRVLIVKKDKFETGIMADAVLGVRLLPVADLKPAMATMTDVRADYLRGITSERLIVLDIASILGDPNIVVNEESFKGGAL